MEEGRCQDEEKDAELEPEAAQLQKQVMAGVVRECRAGGPCPPTNHPSAGGEGFRPDGKGGPPTH